MKAGDMTEGQIVGILQEAEKGEKHVADLCREKGNSSNTFYVWKRNTLPFGWVSWALQTSDVKRLRDLERENARPKWLLAERDLDIDILRKVASKDW